MPENDSNLLRSSSLFRDKLLNRSLYNIDENYPVINDSTLNNMVNSINSVIDAVMPFKGFDLNNSVYNSILNFDNQTPLVKISLNMLSKQMGLNEASHLMQQNFPVFNVGNLFDNNNNTSLFTLNKDWKITSNSKTDISLKNMLNGLSINGLNKQNNLNNNSNKNLVENTGKGQLSLMLNLLSKNKYKPIEEIYNNKSIELNITQYSQNSQTDTYNKDNTDNLYINDLGYTKKKLNNSIDSVLDNSRLSNDIEIKGDLSNNSNKIVWGRDGFGINTQKDYLKGDFNNLNKSNVTSINEFNESFNVNKSGILSNTRKLVSEGKIKNLTNKLFEEGNGEYGFSGSGVWKSNNSEYARNSGIHNKTGVRQHNAIDQYDKFTKAIRFNGNEVYGGNKNSVINKTIIPNFFPKPDGDKFNTKNIMLSIENLAFNINAEGMVTNDIYHQTLPKHEIGPNNGRVMWFPPYGIEINEVANAKFESTVTVGRNEPMYNYISSERTATLNFMLIMDYPSQLKNYINSPTAQKDISEFFLFGGDKVNEKNIINNIKNQIEDINNELIKFVIIDTNNTPTVIPTIPTPISIYYPNNVPSVSGVTNVVNLIYKNGYEVNDTIKSAYEDSVGCGLNSNIIDLYGIDILHNIGSTGEFIYNTIDPNTNTNQYNYDVPITKLDEALFNLFSIDNSENIITIKLTSTASKLYHTGNKELCNRRNEAAKFFIEGRLSFLFKNKDIEKYNFQFINDEDNNSSDLGKSKDEIYNPLVKLDRKTTIEFVYSPKTSSDDITFRNPSDRTKYEELSKQKAELETIKSQYEKNSDFLFNERTITTDAILRGYMSIKNNHYYPGLHTQTPEDFHRRLTFLHQCTRQGGSKNYNNSGEYISKNSVFGKQPICVLRIGDFFHSKVIIESINFDYTEAPWDMNPEGFGLQPMLAKITLNMKVIGGQSLEGPISVLQNALSYNYYANSTYTDEGIYKIPTNIAINEYKLGEKITPTNPQD